MKIVTTNEAPDLTPDHFSRAPKTLYRQGEGKGRIEEQPAPDGVHLLIVVNEPDLWIADLAKHTGQHQVDGGPSFYFRAKLFGIPQVKSKFINSLELGCEIQWLLEAGARPVDTVHPTLGSVSKFEFQDGDERVVLFARGSKPVAVELYGPAGWLLTTHYLSYERDIEAPARLFAKPRGVRYAETGT